MVIVPLLRSSFIGRQCLIDDRMQCSVQESVQEEFIAKVKRRMKTLRVGDSLDKCVDMGPVAGELEPYCFAAR